MTSLPNDTIWIPGEDVNDTLGGIWGQPFSVGKDLTHYNYVGYNFHLIQADSVLVDIITPSVYTGYYGSTDSITQVYNGATTEDSTADALDLHRMFKIVPSTDSNSTYWFDKYAWARIIVSTISVSDTIDTNTVDKGLWSMRGSKDTINTTVASIYGTAGDSVNDWNPIPAAAYYQAMNTYRVLADSKESTYVYVRGKDTLSVFSTDGITTSGFHGNPAFDSLVIRATVTESLTVITADSIRVGVAIGDSASRHLSTMTVVWGATRAIAGAAAYQNWTWTFTTNQRGVAWTVGTIDSLMLVIDAVHMDTVAAGTPGILKVTSLRYNAYYTACDSLADWHRVYSTYTDPAESTSLGYKVLDDPGGTFIAADYLYVRGKDTVSVFSTGGSGVVDSCPGLIDSLVIYAVVSESLALSVTGNDSIRVGIAFGDSSKHHLDSLSSGYGGALTWGTTKVVHDSAAYTAMSWTFATNPRGNEWTRSNIDSLMIAVDAVHVDTIDAGTNGMLKLCVLNYKVYHRRDTLYPPLKYRVDLIMKE